MRLPKGWNQPKRISEDDVVAAMKLAFDGAQLAGVPIVMCVIKPSDESRVPFAMLRASQDHPEVPSAEDAVYLAATAMFTLLRHYPEESRPTMRRIVLEHFDQMIYNNHGGEIPPHLIESDDPPSVMGEEDEAP